MEGGNTGNHQKIKHEIIVTDIFPISEIISFGHNPYVQMTRSGPTNWPRLPRIVGVTGA
jgi:hypothetical protein